MNDRIDRDALIRVFYENSDELAQFSPVDAAEIPADRRQLLDHHEHMTVTVEEFYGCPVNLEVIRAKFSDNYYFREILLRRSPDLAVVQYGIVRLDLEQLRDQVRTQIEQESTPLGRILIEHDVHRKVQLHQLWQLAPGKGLQGWLNAADQPVFGRTASISVQGKPAILLLEVVANPADVGDWIVQSPDI